MINKTYNIALLVFLAALVQGCSSLSYYWEKIQGHTEIINNQHPVQEVIDNPKTSETVRAKLISTQKARRFATEVLKLPDNDSYKNYVDINRDYVVWSVVATPPYSIKAKQWCFLIVGCLSYKGYFSKQDAELFAKELRTQNMDVYVSGTKAYSTLGWFDDPLLSTMLYNSEAYRVGIIFHELAHQKMYVADDTAFNEAFATSVELEGVKAWFNQDNKEVAFKKYLVSKKRDDAFKKLLQSTRQKLKQAYDHAADKNNADEKQDLAETKKIIFVQLQQGYKKLKQQWDGYTGYDKWMSQDLNNAHLALIATYNDRIPAFRQLFKKANNNYALFYNQVEKMTELDKPQRDEQLNLLMKEAN